MGSEARNLFSLMKKDGPVKEYAAYLNEQISSLKPKMQKDAFGKIVGSSNSQFIECIAELTAMSLWKHFKWDYEKDSKINGKTPDFKVTIDSNNSFIAEVTILRSNHPHREILIKRERRNIFDLIKSVFAKNPIKQKLIIQNQITGEILKKLPPATQPIEQSNRVNVEINQKFHKYNGIIKTLDMPFIICFYQPKFKDYFYIDDFQINNALYGNKKINFSTGETFHYPEISRDSFGNPISEGIFCFKEYSNLTAIVFIIKQFSIEKQKYIFLVSIYSNPLGKWGRIENNPLNQFGLKINSIDENDNIIFAEPNTIELY